VFVSQGIVPETEHWGIGTPLVARVGTVGLSPRIVGIGVVWAITDDIGADNLESGVSMRGHAWT
jgi:hypothetical protein